MSVGVFVVGWIFYFVPVSWGGAFRLFHTGVLFNGKILDICGHLVGVFVKGKTKLILALW